MKRTLTALLGAAILAPFLAIPQEKPEMPQPQKEHAWLQRFAGEWETETEVLIPGQPPMKVTGTESARMLGGFWIVSEGKGQFAGNEYNSILTLGFDPAAAQYTGTFVDSMNGHLWKYEGSVDDSGNVLTLECSGPCMLRKGKITQFREVIEFKDSNNRTFTSSSLDDDGKWTVHVRSHARRKKA